MPTSPANRAMSLNNLSDRLADLGRREEALAAIEEAAEHLPGAGRGPPGRVPARPGHVAEQPVEPPGRPGAAGGGAGRDRGGRRHLPGAGRGPPGRVPARPGQVAEQPVGRLADLGRREEALAAIEEATGIYRELAAARPDAFRPDLATSLDNLADTFSSLNRDAEASAIHEEADAARSRNSHSGKEQTRRSAAHWPLQVFRRRSSPDLPT